MTIKRNHGLESAIARDARKMNARFCRIMLRNTMLDLTFREAAHFKRFAGVLRTAVKRWYLVEWPRMGREHGETYRWEGQADNSDHARYQALQDWQQRLAPIVRERCYMVGFPDIDDPTLKESLDPRRGELPIADNE